MENYQNNGLLISTDQKYVGCSFDCILVFGIWVTANRRKTSCYKKKVVLMISTLITYNFIWNFKKNRMRSRKKLLLVHSKYYYYIK